MPVNLLKLMAFSFGAAVAALTGTLFAVAQRERLPAHVLVPAADHRLHDGDPRRPGQPRRRRRRRGARERAARAAARPGRRAHPLLRRSACSRSSFAFGRSRKLATLLGGIARLRLRRARRSPDAINHAGSRGPTAERLRPTRSRTGSSSRRTSPTGSARSPTSAYLPRARAHAGARLAALRRCSSRRSTSARSCGRTSCSPSPDATRYIVLGAMLIALMIVRPNGLFGERRVEII